MGISLLVFNMKLLTKHPSKSEKPCNKIFYFQNISFIPKSEYISCLVNKNGISQL